MLVWRNWIPHHGFPFFEPSPAQALGRCIRHNGDYGSIILLDSRHCNDGSPGFLNSRLPKWMRYHVRTLSMHQERGYGHLPVVGGFQGLSREMQMFFNQAPLFTQAVMDKTRRDFEEAKARESLSGGHRFNSVTGTWIHNSTTSSNNNGSASCSSSSSCCQAITQDSPIPSNGTLCQNQQGSGSNCDTSSGLGDFRADENKPNNPYR